ncbi:MAG: hypothetical protein IKA68_02800 [Clostridia bacterium]|nr:hypothetical protein [Clostridia bacterium]
MEERNNGQSGFSYTYSAKEQAELKRIRDKYTQPPETEDKMARLYRLDASVTNTAKTVAIILGIVGALILGFGMSLIMTELSSILGAYSDMAMVIGIAIGVLGGVLVSVAYPIYNAIVRAKRKKLAPEIIRLTDELMN